MLDFVERNVIFSIKPHYAHKILAGHKTVELRRRFSNEAVVGAVAFIYASSPVQSMLGYARIADVRKLPLKALWKIYGTEACLAKSDFDRYFTGLEHGYVIVLEDVKPLLNSVPADVLKIRFGFRAPQSYRYATTEYCALIA